MDGCSQFDPQLGYVPAIPEPFWLKKWWWWNYRPHCYQCNVTFKLRGDWDAHYVLNHIPPTPSQEPQS